MVSPVLPDPPVDGLFRFRASRLDPVDTCEATETELIAADSWLVDDGRVRAWPMHRARFSEAILRAAPELADELEAFLAAVVDATPLAGVWFPRVELQSTRGATSFVYRVRPAPELTRSVRLATYRGADPRRDPRTKGPDLGRLLAVRTSLQPLGADEAVILTDDGFVVEGAYSSLIWWRGDTLCLPHPDLPRIDGVTARSVVAIATARGTDVAYESVEPADLDGLEVWATSALHGIRIATSWVDGPDLAEHPGRLAAWRAGLDKLRRPIGTLSP